MGDEENAAAPQAAGNNNAAPRRAPIRFAPPSNFSFKPEEWPQWIQRFGRYRRSGRLDEEEEDRQVDALLYAMGEQSEVIFETFHLGDNATYAQVVEQFENHYTPRRNRTFQRKQFHESTQGTKTVDEFERELHVAAKYCEFVDLEDQLCDQFVFGLHDSELKQRLCLENDLTIERAVTMAKQSESIKKDLGKSVDTVRAKFAAKKKNQPEAKKKLQAAADGKSCSRCGNQHEKTRCPAKGRTCNYCKGRDHFAIVCKKKKSVHEIEAKGTCNEIEATDFLLDSVEIEALADAVVIEEDSKPWTEEIQLCGSVVKFKIDTRADITVINQQTYDRLKKKPVLSDCTASVSSPGGELLVRGIFTTELQRMNTNDTAYQCRVIVADIKSNLLSRAVSHAMGLVK
jgi:hypothetical protein